MTRTAPARATTRRTRIRRRRAAGVLAAIVTAAGVVGSTSLSSSLTVPSPPAASPRSSPEPPAHRPRDRGRSTLGEADGSVPAGTTVFEDDVPGVARLDPALLVALRRAATDAAGGGVELVVDSGWRSPAYQAQLFREAVAEYGSEEEAARWVAPGTTSPHVSGDAVDLGPADARPWLSAHGAAYGLCQVYANEPWHYELRPEAVAHGCPAMYADPTEDPRMRADGT